jgi:CHAP domain
MTAAPLRTRSQRKRPPRRWAGILLALLLLAGLAVGVFLETRPSDYTVLHFHGETVRVPKVASLSPLRKRIVAIAESQLGYVTDPASTYCNKYSAYWVSGADDCGNSNLAEEWCADFAAWVWEQAGADVTYQYVNGDLNSSAASFYEWGAARGTWHPAGSRYQPLPGDVAVYGLDEAALVAAHVAVVIGYTPGERGPIAVNGDGDLTGFSVVEVATDEVVADTHPGSAVLSGYVSPT